MNFRLSHPTGKIQGRIRLDGSKSISNRALIIRALSGADFDLPGLATAKDTVTMEHLISSDQEVLDVGPAGTTFRFLTSYLALKPGRQILTGSERMLQRPIGALVDALNGLGAKISYQDRVGYPPLVIEESNDWVSGGTVRMPATISSQFISALLMIAPKLPGGLTIVLEGKLVSPSYLQMTISIMEQFGIAVDFDGQVIKIQEQSYQTDDFVVEADWSAASYHFALAALAKEADFYLEGLHQSSWQGDAICSTLFQDFGVESTWEGDLLHLKKTAKAKRTFTHDYIDCPDIAQTVAVVAAALGTPAVFTGLETLRIKETDRIQALKDELIKVGVAFFQLPGKLTGTDKETFMTDGKAVWSEAPSFATYHDHRMAMAFAPLALVAPIIIEDVAVVDKSYPDFWKDLAELGFVTEVV